MSVLVKPITWILGISLLLIGIAGFVSGNPFSMLEGNATQSIAYLISGIIALLAVYMGHGYSRFYLIVFGLLFIIITILGLFSGGILNLFVGKRANNILHFTIAIVCLLVGYGSKK